MAKKDKKTQPDEITKDDVRLNSLYQDLYKRVLTNTYDSNIDVNKTQINDIMNKIDDVLNGDLDEMKKYGGQNDLTRFLLVTLQNSGQFSGINNATLQQGNDADLLESIFLSKDGSIFSTFEERFKNKMLLFHDLEIISEQLPELREAIYVTRDDIVSADDLGSEISRSLSFTSDLSDDERYDSQIEEVKELEKEYKLPYIIREHIVPKTLNFGEYYVYVIPEEKLFENTQRQKIAKTNGATLESYEAESIYENLDIDKRGAYKDFKPSEISMYVSENIKINNTDVPLPLIESENTVGLGKDLKAFNSINELLKNAKKKKGKNKKNTDISLVSGFSDGVKSMKIDDWGGVKGCYIRLLDPKRVIPVKVLNYTIGYYYLNDTELGITNHNCKSHTYRFGSLIDQVDSKSEQRRSIVHSIAQSIIKSFDKKYLEDNQEFKDLIINSLLYNDMYKRKLHYQFIPADNMCRFSVNEDENGNGQSMLYKSLFYAKLYLSLLVFNMVTHLTKSQDTIVTYVKTSGIDKNVYNKTMSVARQMKSKQIGLGDLMDYSSIYSKIGTGRDIYIPEGESGERGLSWDVIQGQDVNMQNELMEQLKESFINGSGVPSVIMNYINEADFAKTLVMANAKHLRRVMMYQDCLAEGITEMYQKIMMYCTDIELEDILQFNFRFQRPKSLPNNNLVDIIGYGDQILDFIEKSEFGQYAEETPDLNLRKDEFRKQMSRKVLSMLPWETVDEIMEDVKLEVAKQMLEKNNDNAEGGEDDYSGDTSGGGSGDIMAGEEELGETEFEEEPADEGGEETEPEATEEEPVEGENEEPETGGSSDIMNDEEE